MAAGNVQQDRHRALVYNLFDWVHLESIVETSRPDPEGARVFSIPFAERIGRTAIVAGTFDTKGRELNFIRDRLKTLGIPTREVLAAAGSKWNFLPFTPGLVGGHCIGVDPYYLTHRAEKAGYHPEVILAGRRINDLVGQRVAQECVRRLLRNGHGRERVTVLGLTFKENVPDIRNSKAVDVVRELSSFGLTVQVHDPLAVPHRPLSAA